MLLLYRKPGKKKRGKNIHLSLYLIYLQRVNIDQIILEETEDNEAQVQTDDT